MTASADLLRDKVTLALVLAALPLTLTLPLPLTLTLTLTLTLPLTRGVRTPTRCALQAA